MDMDKRILRIGAGVIAAAMVLRLLSGGALGTVAEAMGQPEVAQLLIFLQTGRLVRLEDPQSVPLPPQVLTPQPEPTQEAPKSAVFTAEDAALVDIHNYCGYSVDTAALLTQPLSWDLTADGPAVLIVHTHGTEAYAESGGYRSDEESENVISIGKRLADLLREGGIEVLHDTTMHDKPSYNGSYNQSRKAVQQYLKDHPSIRLVLDIHRDAAEDSSGKQINYTVTTEQGKAAKLMLVVGTNAGGLQHPDWQQNMALAVKLHAQLEKRCPDICRPISFRTSRFNQDLSPGAMLIEVGAAGNTHGEAMLAAQLLAQGILDLAHGAGS